MKSDVLTCEQKFADSKLQLCDTAVLVTADNATAISTGGPKKSKPLSSIIIKSY